MKKGPEGTNSPKESCPTKTDVSQVLCKGIPWNPLFQRIMV